MFTIIPRYTRPQRSIVAVDSMFKTAFCAVPAFMRVEPATISLPVTTAMGCSAASGGVTTPPAECMNSVGAAIASPSSAA